MKSPLLPILALLGLGLSALADTALPALPDPTEPNPFDDEDTIRFLISKSTLVIVATVQANGFHMGSGPIFEPGVYKPQPMQLTTALTIERVLYGSGPAEKNLWVDVFRMGAQNGVSGITLNDKERYIFFLKPSKYEKFVNEKRVEWRTVDVWFGVYPFDTTLAERLKELEWERFKKERGLEKFPETSRPRRSPK